MQDSMCFAQVILKSNSTGMITAVMLFTNIPLSETIATTSILLYRNLIRLVPLTLLPQSFQEQHAYYKKAQRRVRQGWIQREPRLYRFSMDTGYLLHTENGIWWGKYR
jgi:hypothetical protein